MQQAENDVHHAATAAFSHYVSLSYYAKSPAILKANNGVAQVCVCSGFVMAVRGLWCLVTAGHVLDGIEREQREGLELSTFRLWDGWKLDAKHRNFIPFDFDGTPKFRVNNDGLDYGLIPLRALTVANLQANDIVPISEEQYEKQWPAEFDGYAMIGTPGKTVSLERFDQTSAVFNQSLCVLDLAEEPSPPSELVTPIPRFYGRILMCEQSAEWQAIDADIAGMSGGPVIAVKRNETGLRYWVIAIQSGWLRSKRIIAASYFQKFARYVGNLMDGETS